MHSRTHSRSISRTPSPLPLTGDVSAGGLPTPSPTTPIRPYTAASQQDADIAGAMHTPRRSLLLLSRERGVQTDPYVFPAEESTTRRLQIPPPLESTRSGTSNSHSDTSSTLAHPVHDTISPDSGTPREDGEKLKDGSMTTTLLTLLLTHSSSLLHRLSATDIPSISARLARHNLGSTSANTSSPLKLVAGAGAVSHTKTKAQKETTLHISRSTISALLTSYSQLRGRLRSILAEQEKMRAGVVGSNGSGVGVEIIVQPQEFRDLLNFVRGALKEVATLRGRVNELEIAAETAVAAGGSWMGGLSKLWAPVPTHPQSQELQRDKDAGLEQPHAHIHAPVGRKATPAPALPVTANVTASSGAPSTSAIHANQSLRSKTPVPRNHSPILEWDGDIRVPKRPSAVPLSTTGSGGTPSGNVKSIFAGSIPRGAGDKEWVVLSRKPSRVFSSGAVPRSRERTLSVNEKRKKASRRLSRNLDAIIDIDGEHDSEVDDHTLTEEVEGDESTPAPPRTDGRTLRRNLSDSSIRSSFISQSPTQAMPTRSALGASPSTPAIGRQAAFPIPFHFDMGKNKGGVLGVLQSFVGGNTVSGTHDSDAQQVAPSSPAHSSSSRGRTRAKTGPRMSRSPSKSGSKNADAEQKKSAPPSTSIWARGDLGRDI